MKIDVNISETSAGYRSNLSPLLIELTFNCKSSTNISIDNRYCNRFIDIGRPIFPVHHNGASVFTIPTTFGIAHSRVGVTLAAHQSPKSATWVGSLLLDSSRLWLFRQPITSLIIVLTLGPTYLQVQNRIAIDLMTMKYRLFFSTSATSNPPFHLVGCDSWCAMTWAFHVLQKICRIKISLQFPHLGVI